MHELSTTSVLELPPMTGNPRNSEGDFIKLADGKWVMIYTHFEGGAGDHASAYLAGRTSTDGGLTWSHEDSLVLSNEGNMNIMSVSLLRLHDRRIAMFYLRKNSLTDCRPCVRISSDEASTWSAPIDVVPPSEPGYYVVNNNRVIQLSGGRLVVPTALHTPSAEETDSLQDNTFSPYGRIFCYLSDDGGATWHRSRQALVEAQPAVGHVMVQEPGVIELRDGRVMMYCRTSAGSQYISHSHDQGQTWSRLHASDIISPCSPATIARIPSTGDLLMVWNNHAGIANELLNKRTPLTVAVSRDEANTWINSRNIKTNPFGWYCYTAIAFEQDHVLLAHTAGDTRENNGLATLQITRLSVTSLYDPS